MATLVERIFAPLGEFESLWISDLLLKLGLAQAEASRIAAEMLRLAEDDAPGLVELFGEAAAAWHRRAGNTSAAIDATQLIISDLQNQAAHLSQLLDLSSVLRAADRLELALQKLRTIPKSEREERGLTGLVGEIVQGISAANAKAASMLTASYSEPIDITDLRLKAAKELSGRSSVKAVEIFLSMPGITDYDRLVADVRSALEQRPLTRLFDTVTFSTDARVIHKTAGSKGSLIFDVEERVWKLLAESFGRRISLVTNAIILPAWIELSNEHNLTRDAFFRLSMGSSIVPAGREGLVSRGLYYGYNGDFTTAAQLLTPQIENLVRVHLQNSGVETRTYEDGVQHEIGLSSLLERSQVPEVFGANLAFELRALFGSPIGPNLRNRYAHGLVSDSEVNSPPTVYLWWLAWKLVDSQFHNSEHEPAKREERETNY